MRGASGAMTEHVVSWRHLHMYMAFGSVRPHSCAAYAQWLMHLQQMALWGMMKCICRAWGRQPRCHCSARLSTTRLSGILAGLHHI